MPPLIQRIAVSAFRTFSKLQVSPYTIPELRELTELVHLLAPEDINFDYDIVHRSKHEPSIDLNQSEESISYSTNANDIPNKAPVVYIHLWEDTVYSMGVFILRAGSSLPLHDHPSMYGVIKVLFGSCAIKSYTLEPSIKPPQTVLAGLKPWQKSNVVCARTSKEHDIINSDSEPCVLTPSTNNLHEIHAINGPMAFLDILAPPYDHATGSRECHYYTDLTKEKKDHTDINVLSEILQPREFWCESAEYCGPKIDAQSMKEV